jgi:acyl-CoA thioesterase
MDGERAMLSPEAVADRSAGVLWARDRASPALGMELLTVGPGAATLRMSVREDMLNGVSTCHGGLIFSLADSAFAFASNSRNQLTVAQHCSVTFHQPAHLGDVLTASCTEVVREGRSGLYDVEVRRGDGALVASFRGHARTIAGTLFEGA